MVTVNRKFNWRGFTSLYMTITGIIIAISGVILFIAPAGRIANWTRIPILGLEKFQWQALHVNFTFLLLIASGFHIYFNWKPLMAYWKSRINQNIKIRMEFIASSILSVALFGLILIEVPPFTSILDFGEGFKDSWAAQQNEPPIPHAEDLSIEELAQTLQEPVINLLSNLAAHGIVAHKNQIIKEIAAEHGTTASVLYEQMKPQARKSEGINMQGQGYGRMTLEEICSQLQVDIDVALLRLQEGEIIAQANESIKNLASDNNMRPNDVVNIIKGIE